MRAFFRGLRIFIWRFMVIFSFIVNIILVGVVVVLLLNLFVITRDIANPLVSGLHSSFIGLEKAQIDWTIPVRDTVPVQFTVPLQTETVVVLTAPVPLSATAQIVLNNSTVTTPVSLTLPVGLQLPVRLDLQVPIDHTLPIALDVRAVIPLEDTQLADVAGNLRLLFEPLAFSLNNLPVDWGGAIQLAADVLSGKEVNLITDPTAYSASPWPGYSRTAGETYAFDFENQRLNQVGIGPVQPTGIVMEGGIQWLDMQLPDRAYLYLEGCDPRAFNAQAAECSTAQAAHARIQGVIVPVPVEESAVPGAGDTGDDLPPVSPETPLSASPPALMTPMLMHTSTPIPFPTSTTIPPDSQEVDTPPGGAQGSHPGG
jgi:hypothetical protein